MRTFPTEASNTPNTRTPPHLGDGGSTDGLHVLHMLLHACDLPAEQQLLPHRAEEALSRVLGQEVTHMEAARGNCGYGPLNRIICYGLICEIMNQPSIKKKVI